jgi:hypothetical protein
MMLEVSRNVATDLWALYQAGEASDDSRRLLDAFMAEDRSFAEAIRQQLPRVVPAFRLSPDAERRLLDDARDRARLKLVLVGLGLLAIVLIVAMGGAVTLFMAPR